MFTKNVLRAILTTAALIGISSLAFAQNMGGAGSPGMPGMPPAGTIPAMHPGSGMNGAAVAGAIGGAAAGAGVIYLIRHNHATLLGCVGDDGQMLFNEKDSQTYKVVSTSETLKPGERIELKGKKIKDESGMPAFKAHKVTKDFGSCRSITAENSQ